MASKTLDSTALRAVASAFRLGGTYCGGAPHGNGHINDTYVVSFEQGGVTTRYILQRINENVFRDVDAVMDNIARVTAHAGRRALASGAPDAKFSINFQTPRNPLINVSVHTGRIGENNSIQIVRK